MRDSLIGFGFALVILGAVADIAHFTRGHASEAAPATLLLQPDTAGPAATLDAILTPTPTVSPPLVAPTEPPGSLFDPVFNTHTVVAGDVLYSIAQRYDTTTEALIDLNAIEDPNRIEVGQVLALPDAATES